MGILRTFLSLDVLLRLRTTERFWNKGERYGTYGDFSVICYNRTKDIMLSSTRSIATLLPGSESSGSMSPDLGIWGHGSSTVSWPNVAAAQYCT